MCSAIFSNQTLARTTDRQGSLAEHRITGVQTISSAYIGGTITTPDGRIWIDGINDSGLMAALLNYRKELTEESAEDAPKNKIHPGKLIPTVLENCRNVKSAADFLRTVTLTEDAPMMFPHYILADKSGNCTVFENGKIIGNPLGILTNAPSFGEQMQSLPDLTAETPAIPWNHTSESRFRRLAWLKTHAPVPETPTDFMNLLDAVAVPIGMDPKPGYRTLVRTVMGANDGTYSFCTEKDRAIRTRHVGETGEFPLI